MQKITTNNTFDMQKSNFIQSWLDQNQPIRNKFSSYLKWPITVMKRLILLVNLIHRTICQYFHSITIKPSLRDSLSVKSVAVLTPFLTVRIKQKEDPKKQSTRWSICAVHPAKHRSPQALRQPGKRSWKRGPVI